MIWYDLFNDQKNPPTITRLADTLVAAESDLAALREENDQTALVELLYKVGQSALALGEGSQALTAFNEAYDYDPSPPVRVAMGSALRLIGHYEQATAELKQVLSEPGVANRICASAEVQIALCALDAGEPAQAEAHLAHALPIFDAEGLGHYGVHTGILQAEVALRLGKTDDVRGLVDTLDAKLTETKNFWLRPALWILRTRLALAVEDYRLAEKNARRGLGSADNRGDGQLLSTLYRGLAAALEHDDAMVEDARDARLRSVSAAQKRTTRIDLARALFETGLHFKLYTNRPTLRARGSGYLYEASQLYQQIGLHAPSSNTTVIPFL